MRCSYVALLALAACSGTPRDGEAATAPTPASEVAAEPTPALGQGYDVGIEVPQTARAGQPAIAWVHVRPRDPWHMNVDFPARLQMKAAAHVRLDAERLERSDAERLDDDGLVFPVVFTPSRRGNTTLSGEVYFAVCGTAECAPVQEAVEFTVAVS